jgi:hypothetical protein
MTLKTAKLGLIRPQHGINEVEGETSGVPNEALNLDMIDTALDALGARGTGLAIADYTASGAISQLSGTVTLSGTGVQVMTLANPTSGTDDGKELTIISKSAHAHTVATVAGIAGGANHKATFGGAVGDLLVLKALGGVWFQLPSINQTLSAS